MNIIYVNPDQMRADFLGCYGNRTVQTPNVDRLAAEGVCFELKPCRWAVRVR